MKIDRSYLIFLYFHLLYLHFEFLNYKKNVINKSPIRHSYNPYTVVIISLALNIFSKTSSYSFRIL